MSKSKLVVVAISMALTALLLSTLSCQPESEAIVIGRYDLIAKDASEVLTLASDHSYVRERDGHIRASGSWRIQKLGGGDTYVAFSPTNSEEVIVVPVRNWLGTIYIGKDEDNGQLFRKR